MDSAQNKKVLLLGCGNIGSLLAAGFSHLGKNLTVVDKAYRRFEGPSTKGSMLLSCDFGSIIELTDLINKRKPDLVISCVPAKYGSNAIQAAVDCGVNIVDVSFADIDPFIFDAAAKEKEITIVPDAGLAPGLTNLFFGRELAIHGKLNRVALCCGGVSKSPFVPYGLASTWSAEDMYDVYLRPARCCFKGKINNIDESWRNAAEAPVNDIMMEDFPSDGLRTLLRFKDKVDIMSEVTLRWPGHIKQVRPLLENGTFVEEISKCKDVDDTVVFFLVFAGKNIKTITMIDHSTNKYTAMTRTTGYTTLTISNLLLKEKYTEFGVHPLEDIGANEECFNFVLDQLKNQGINFITETGE